MKKDTVNNAETLLKKEVKQSPENKGGIVCVVIKAGQ